MQISEFVKECFNKHLPHFYLLVIEDKNINIYERPYESLIISQSLDINYQMIKVLEIINRDNEITFKIQLPNNKKGYFTPKSSILLLPKKNKQVKISDSSNLENELNLHLHIDQNLLQENRSKVLFSKQYAIFNNKIYETLVLIDEIIGFIEQKEVNILHRYSSEFKIKTSTNTYSDNAMTKPVSIIKDYDQTFKTQYVMPSENKIRLKYKGSNLWIDSKNTDLEMEIKERKFTDVNEIIIESILSQYEEKVNNYHKYYNKLISK